MTPDDLKAKLIPAVTHWLTPAVSGLLISLSTALGVHFLASSQALAGAVTLLGVLLTIALNVAVHYAAKYVPPEWLAGPAVRAVEQELVAAVSTSAAVSAAASAPPPPPRTQPFVAAAPRAAAPLILLALLLVPLLAGGCGAVPLLLGQPQPQPTTTAPAAPSGVQQALQAHQTFDAVVAGLTIARDAKLIDDATYHTIDGYVQAGAKALADLDAHAGADPLTLTQYLSAFNKAVADLKTQQAQAVTKSVVKVPATKAPAKTSAAKKPAAKPKPAAPSPGTPVAPAPAPTPLPDPVEEGPPPEQLPNAARQPVCWYARAA